MPYRWTEPDTLTLWPHRSLAPRGFVWFIGLTAGFLAVPVLSQIGHATLWILLAFVSLALALVWAAIRRNQRDRAVTETLHLAPDRLHLRREARQRRDWEANPHWVRLTLYQTGGPVPDYLTLTGNGREVEIGAFLTPEERRQLREELVCRLADLR